MQHISPGNNLGGGCDYLSKHIIFAWALKKKQRLTYSDHQWTNSEKENRGIFTGSEYLLFENMEIVYVVFFDYCEWSASH